MDVRGADLILGDDLLRPGVGRILRPLPPGEPVAACERLTLGADAHVAAAVAVDIAEAEVMAAAGSVSLGQHVANPALGAAHVRRAARAR